MMTEGNLTLGNEHTMPYTDDVLLNYTLEICITLLTNVTPINLITKKNLKRIRSKLNSKVLLTEAINQITE